jgi:Fur family peroxide stress response transcriptional regulator
MDCVELLKQKGIQPSVQRMQILDYLSATAFIRRWMIFMPPCIRNSDTFAHDGYNTVKLFVSEGLVQPLVIEENEIRYDIDTSFHGHFRCDRCGHIYDFSTGDIGCDPARQLQGFSFRALHVYGMGVCRACAGE